jgi:hypothetical protein
MRTDRSRGMPDYAPYSWRRCDDGPARRRQQIADLKEKFASLNDWINQQGGAWLTSIPGDFEAMMECLPSSDVPERLRDRGYDLKPDGEGERIIPHAIVETILAEDGKKPIRKVTHAGIVGVQRYGFLL